MATPTKSRRSAASSNGYVEVEPPPKRVRRRSITAEDARGVLPLLEGGKWLSNNRGYRSRSAAGHRASLLIGALSDIGVPRSELKRRTWLNGSRFYFAVRREMARQSKRQPKQKRSRA